ncbi:hypothetical protein [Paenibacillus konkukensis]|nr:hypothetical protein [Paenibacillus konkukensis]
MGKYRVLSLHNEYIVYIHCKTGGSAQMPGSSNTNYLKRLQFSVHVHDQTLNRILNGIANRGISITGYTQTKRGNLNFVKLVVGPPGRFSIRANRGVREVLRSLGVRFREEIVIQFLNTVAGTPGVIRSIYEALFRHVRVKAMYYGENTAIFINTSRVNEAIAILKRKHIIQ